MEKTTYDVYRATFSAGYGSTGDPGPHNCAGTHWQRVASFDGKGDAVEFARLLMLGTGLGVCVTKTEADSCVSI